MTAALRDVSYVGLLWRLGLCGFAAAALSFAMHGGRFSGSQDEGPWETSFSSTDDKITIAAIGASITWGLCSSDPHTKSWPAVLQDMLDASYGKGAFEVLNFGSCGRVMTIGHFWSYENSTEWTLALESGADIVTIDLGGDDADVVIAWDEDGFRYSYRKMISQLRALPSAPSILPFSELAFHHIAQDNNEFVGSVEDIAHIRNHVLPGVIAGVAADEGIDRLFDEWALFGGARRDWPDGANGTNGTATLAHDSANRAWYCPALAYGDLHPNDNGYHHLAEAVRPHIEDLAGDVWAKRALERGGGGGGGAAGSSSRWSTARSPTESRRRQLRRGAR